MCPYVWGHTCVTVHVRRSEDNMSTMWVRAIELRLSGSGKHICPLSRLLQVDKTLASEELGSVFSAKSEKDGMVLAVVVHSFNPSTWEAEAGESLNLRTAWAT